MLTTDRSLNAMLGSNKNDFMSFVGKGQISSLIRRGVLNRQFSSGWTRTFASTVTAERSCAVIALATSSKTLLCFLISVLDN